MVCKFCNAKVDGRRKFCSECGMSLRGEAEPVLDTEEAILQEEVLQEEVLQEEASQKEKPKGKVWKLALMIAGIVAAAAVLAVVLLQQFGVDIFSKLFPEQNITIKETYSASSELVTQSADTVVAKLGDAELTNAVLQIFCREEFNAFLQQYYMYISQIGLDLSTPLSEQTCYFDQTMTWEQYMINTALQSWESYVHLGTMADAAGFTLEGDWKTTLDAIPQQLEESAKENEFDSADAMLKDRYGDACTVDVYMAYINLIFKSNAFYASNFEFTDEQVDAAFTKYEEELAEDGITKTSRLVSSVRHILIAPEGGTKSEDGQTTTYSEQEWAACLAKAEQVLEEWKSGKATEESFVELGKEYTDDTGFAENNGLYEEITFQSSYVEGFRDWAVDFNRKPGETGIVKTEFGYHIMYFVEGEPEWSYFAESKLYEEKSKEIQESLKALQAESSAKISYKKIVLSEIYQYEQ